MMYLLFFYSISIITGTLTSLATYFVVQPHWNMLAGMFVGMALGFTTLIFIFFLFARIAGPFEIVSSGMFTAKFAGMVSGMWITMGEPNFSSLITTCAITGCIIHGIFHCYDRTLHGEVEIKS